MDARCRIELLGGLRITQGERVITRFRTQKFGTLIAYLAYHRSQPHPRDVLIEMLWPGCEPVVGRQRLSMALSSLRSQLEPPGVPAGAILRADRFTVQANPEAVTTDVVEFEEALKLAARSRSRSERVQRLADAIALYAGPLLPGYYEEWVLTDQGRLEDLFWQAIRRLVAHCEQEGDLEAALRYAGQAVRLDPLREEAHRDLMRLYVADGQAAQALRQYRELERLLDQELGEPPSAETRTLAHQIERNEAATRTRPPRGLAPTPARTAGDRSSRPVSKPSAASLPGGTVTFLLTDIERSTAQWERAGDAFGAALATHHALLRQTFRQHGGHEIKEAGDSFLVAFARPSDALACAVAGQQALMGQEWPEEVGPVRVRMALHTGEVELKEGEYHGVMLHRAARMLAAAHGGQILCSEATVGLVRRDLEPGVRLGDLGVYRLRDVEMPERLYQVEYPQMVQRDFPPLLAEPGHAGHLPLSFTRFFGREEEIGRLREMLLPSAEGVQAFRHSGVQDRSGRDVPSPLRLLTLTGPGGTGKTRLALEVARRLVEPFSGAVRFVPLADLEDGRLIADTIVDAMRLPRSPNTAPLEQVVEALSRQPSLLVLDNVEHLVADCAALVQALLERVPSLTVLVTSRQRLDLSGEREFVVPPLQTPNGPDKPEQLSMYESVQLFVDRAQAVRPDFQITSHNAAAVAEICDRLEGIPLAIELAAARAQVLTPGQMLSQLERRFDFLVSRRRDMTERHQTLRAAVDWSYRLLSSELQRFFGRLSVFRGGWSVEAAEVVCEEPLALDYLAQLRECSLVLAEDEGPEIRFRMLETLREYAEEQLTEEEHPIISRRHLDYFLALAEEANPKLDGAEQAVWFAVLEMEHDNLRVALRSSVVAPPDIGLRLSGALRRFWEVRGHLSEGRAWYASFLAQLQGQTAERAEALHSAGVLAYNQADYDSARLLYEESLTISRGLEDKQRIARTLNSLGLVSEELGDSAQAREYFAEMLSTCREIGDQWKIGMSLLNVGNVAEDQGDYAQARAYYEESLAILREKGSRQGVAFALKCLGGNCVRQHAWAEATAHYHEALDIFREDGNRHHVAWILRNLANLAAEQGDYARARTHLAENMSILHEIGDRMGLARSLEALASHKQAQGRGDRAARLWSAGERLREEIGAPLSPLEREEQDRAVAVAREALGEEAFVAAWAEGRAMTLEQTVAYALQEDT